MHYKKIALLITLCQTVLTRAWKEAEMSSAAKTLDLLSYFSVTRPEIGLSELCRLAKRDKATTHRHLQSLEEAGFVEKNPATRSYRLGPAVLQLAHTREVTVPRKASAEPTLARLAEITGETSHVSVLSGGTLYPLFSCESQRHSTRIIMDAQRLPLHATASGLCALAFGPAGLLETAAVDLASFTPQTLRTREALAAAVAQTRETGFGQGKRSYQQDVVSLAAPVFDQTGAFAGAVSVASVATRFTAELEARICANLMIASRDITRTWGGRIPASLEATWVKCRLPNPTQDARS